VVAAVGPEERVALVVEAVELVEQVAVAERAASEAAGPEERVAVVGQEEQVVVAAPLGEVAAPVVLAQVVVVAPEAVAEAGDRPQSGLVPTQPVLVVLVGWV
jgi:hypothetical protein